LGPTPAQENPEKIPATPASNSKKQALDRLASPVATPKKPRLSLSEHTPTVVATTPNFKRRLYSDLQSPCPPGNGFPTPATLDGSGEPPVPPRIAEPDETLRPAGAGRPPVAPDSIGNDEMPPCLHLSVNDENKGAQAQSRLRARQGHQGSVPAVPNAATDGQDMAIPALMEDRSAGSIADRDPGLTHAGRAEAKRVGREHKDALAGIDVAFVSPLCRAALTALLMLPDSTKLIFTSDLAEFPSDYFAKDGTPVIPKKTIPITHRDEELTGRTRRELEAPEVLGELLRDRDVEWDGIALDDAWWDRAPETQSVAKQRVQGIVSKISQLPRHMGVAVVGHSYWLKVAIPYATRPKGTPNPIGTAAQFWPKNATPYMGELHMSSELRVLRKLVPEDNASDTAAALRDTNEQSCRKVMLIRHGVSQAQEKRSAEKKSRK